MYRLFSRVVPVLLACLSSACAISEADWPGTGTSLPGSARSLLPSHQSSEQLAVGLPDVDFHDWPEHLRNDASEQAFRRSRLISYDFVQAMIQLDALHPRKVRFAIAPSESRFDEIFVYSLTLAGYDTRAGGDDTLPSAKRLAGDDGVVSWLNPGANWSTEHGRGHADDLPRVIDPLLDHRALAPGHSDYSSRAGSTGLFSAFPVVLTTRIVAEPPLLPGGESEAGIYSFFVSANRLSAPEIRFKRIYRASRAGVVPVSDMQIEGVDSRHLRTDDTVF